MAFEGVMTALVTPFQPDGSLDRDQMSALVRRQVEAGIGGLVPCGTTGEAPTLDPDEHAVLFGITVDAAGDVPVLAGIGSNNTAAAIQMAHVARAAGVQGVLATTPYYNKPTQSGLYAHFRAIAQAVPDLEVCIYDVPGRTALGVDPGTMARLAQIDNVTCAKDATADLAKGAEVIRSTPPDFHVLSGDDFTTMPFLAMGGHGAVSVVSNLIPARLVALADAVRAGKLATAAAENAQLQPLFRALFVQTNPLPIKTALAMQGLCEETFRLPLCPMDAGPRAELQSVLEEFELL